MRPGDIAVGDRVKVHPESRQLAYLRGEWGTVYNVVDEDVDYIGGALYVRMDCDGQTLGVGPSAVVEVVKQSRVVFDARTEQEMREQDEAKTGQVRCIGCGKFVARKSRWNQCPECDTREPWEMR